MSTQQNTYNDSNDMAEITNLEINTGFKLRNKVVILNAPKSAGKDTVADALCTLTKATHSRFKHHLYLCTASLFRMSLRRFMQLAEDIVNKEVPHKELVLSGANYTELCKHTKDYSAFTVDKNFNIHISPREALIFTSEVVIKPIMGTRYFGEAAVSYLDPRFGNVFSDGGFQEELLPIVEEVGAENVYVVKFTREGSDSFDGDSRNWLDTEGILPDSNVLTATNNGTIEDIVEEIMRFVCNK